MEGSSKIPLIVIAGPTASGKTAVSLGVCSAIEGEVISADSMQIYKGLDIGTAKASAEERSQVPHHLVDIVDPHVSYSAADFVRDAGAAAADIAARGKIPVVCGGTGFYIDSLVNGAEFDDKGRDSEVRDALSSEAAEKGLAALYSRLMEQDPVYAASIHMNDAKRIIRGLEIIAATGSTPTSLKGKLVSKEPRYELLYYVLASEDRQVLYDRIESRIDAMVEQGVLAEAKIVFENQLRFKTASQAIGYKEFFPYFAGEATLDECISALKTATRHYAKRQVSWFKRSGCAEFLYIDKMSTDEIVEYIAANAKNRFFKVDEV